MVAEPAPKVKTKEASPSKSARKQKKQRKTWVKEEVKLSVIELE